ncbi:hypothetical protein [Pseudoxanthomonas sp.]|uniref:hypothetical protein n=1 Tax=Pseudoxanthomonas sp. TaxID=1871049 RepID=UPI002FE31048
MHHPARNASPLPWIAVALLAASALLMWWPALRTPFWGDDYVFLHAAHATNAAGAPWWSDFWPSSPPRFWRPLSQEGYWRWIDASLGGSAHAAHVVSLMLHVLATLGVALFAFRLARACRWPHAGRIAALAGAVYGGLTLHLLPVHWAAAANNAMLTLFTSLLLAAWVSARNDTAGVVRHVLLASLSVWLALALLSKESAALTPALMLVVAGFVATRRLDRGELVAWLACVAVVAVWLSLRSRFTANTDASYAMSLGSHVLRNAASFMAWLLNVPREAMRMAVAGERMQGLAWIAATALPMLAAWAIAGWRGRTLLTRMQWGCVAAFAVLAYAPYFLFAWNSYEYYAAIAAILPVIVLARCVAADGAALPIAALIAVSSWIAVEGTRRLDHPGLIGRAHWAEATLQSLEQQPVAAPLSVSVADDQRFYAIGQMGLAWRLGLPPEQIHVARECPASGTCLVIDADGQWRWRRDAD